MTETRIEEAEDIEAEIRKKPLTGTKPHSTPLTLKWLEDNYETSEGVCIPRSTLYLHYLEFCQQQDCSPVNAASFGKIIRQQFPQITTRRLGTRGQSKYHYYGIAVRESSPYYDVIYSAKGVQNSGEGKKESTKQLVAYSPRSKLGTLLPPFPEIHDMNTPDDMDQDKVMTFLVMYRTHCQRILDTVIRANFDEVENFLHHFWQGMPGHLTPILATPLLTTVIGLCDSILYRTLCEVLIPSVIQPLPESLTQVIGQFADQIDRWVEHAMTGMALTLKDSKLELSRQFSQTLRRQLSVNHLVQATRSVLTSSDVITQMLSDWLTIDLGSIAQQTLYTMEMEENDRDRDLPIIWNICTDIEKLLDTQSPIESYIEWLDDLIDTWVAKKTPKTNVTNQTTSRQFLLLWTCFSSRVIRDMTIQGVPSFGSFHLLHLLLDDYVLYKIQNLNAEDRQCRFRRIITGQLKEEDVKPEVVLPDTSQVTLPLGPFITPSTHPDNFLHQGLFPESLFDYGSSSEFCTSEEDEDDDNDDENDDDKCFVPSPFLAYKDNFLQKQTISRNECVPTSLSPCGKSISPNMQMPQEAHPHHKQQQQQQQHHHHQYSIHHHPPQQQPVTQHASLNMPHVAWTMAPQNSVSQYHNPSQTFNHPQNLMTQLHQGPHHQLHQRPLQHFPSPHSSHAHHQNPYPHHQHHQPNPNSSTTSSHHHRQQHQNHQHKQEHHLKPINTKHLDQDHLPNSRTFHKPTDTLVTPDLLTVDPTSPFRWISSTSLSSINQDNSSLVANNTINSFKTFSRHPHASTSCQLTTPTATHIPNTSYKIAPISNQEAFTTQGIMSSSFPSPHIPIQDGRHMETNPPSCHSIGLLG